MPALRTMRNEQCFVRNTLDCVLVLPPGSPLPIELTGTAALAWSLLEEPVCLEELAADLAEYFRLSTDAVHTDLVHLVDRLRALGAISDCAPEP